MKRLLISLATLAALAIPIEANAHPCQHPGCFGRAGYYQETGYTYISYSKITNWNINYNRVHIQTRLGDIILFNDGRVHIQNKNGDSLSGTYYYDEDRDFVLYVNGWDRPIVLDNPVYGGY